MGKLQQKAIRGVKWTTLETLTVAVCSLILLVIQAKFLLPAEFAALAIVTIFIGLFRLFEDFGISQAIIQRNDIQVEESSSLLILNILLSLLLGFSLFFFSNFFAIFFEMEELKKLLKLTSLIVILNGPSLLFRAFLEKSLHFKELSISNIAKNILLVISTLVFLYSGLGILGVLLGQIISVAFGAIAIILIGIRKKTTKVTFYFKFSKVRSFLGFGGYVTGKQIMAYLTTRIDEFLIAYLLSPEILGAYHFAKNMLENLRSLLTASFSKVLYSVLSKVKNDQNKLTFVYMKVSRYVAFFAFPIFIGVSITSHLFVPIFFGEAWKPSIPFFQVFSIVLILLVLTANITTSLLYSIGKPNVVFYIDVITSCLYILVLYLFKFQNVYLIMTLYCSYIVVKCVLLQYFTNKCLSNSFYAYILNLKNVIIATLLMGIAVITINKLVLEGFKIFWQLIISIVIGVLLYFLGVLILEKKTVKELNNAFLKGRLGD